MGIRFIARNHHARTGKASVKIGMAVGDISPCDPRQPYDFVQAEQTLQFSFALRFAHARIAVAVEDAALGDDGGALAVHFDAATFHDKITAQLADAGLLAHEAGDLGIAFVVLFFSSVVMFFSPAIEIEIDRGQFALAVFNKYRSGIAHPQVIDGLDDQLGRCTAFAGGDRIIFLPHQHVYRLKG
ncbi:hypothetical protein WJ63_06605 [Burkholderia pyrrocinia]|nr:hypothetical protein WJ63_06605 [Burkholderia pyrrocinia]